MEVLIEQKMIEIKSEPLEIMVDHHHHHKPTSGRRRSSSSPGSQAPAELEPCEEFPILYGLLTAPKSFKPKNSEELQLLPPLELFNSISDSKSGSVENGSVGVRVTSRVQLVQCRRRRGSSEDSTDELDENDDLEEGDSQNFDFNGSSGSSSRSSSRSPHMVDSSSNLSAPEYRHRDYSTGASSNNSQNGEVDMSEDESTCSLVGSPDDISCSGGDDSVDDNIPTSTTSGFKRKACRLETAIGNIVRRRVRVQKRSSNSNNNNSNNSNRNPSNVPISMAPSSPTVSTTCVDPPTPPSRGRSEILERILRSTNNTTTNQQHSPPLRRNHGNDDNSNNEGSYDGPYAKLRDLLTMSEDQLVKRRRIEYGLNENNNAKVYQTGQSNQEEESSHVQRRREFSPPRNNILASLLQKGRAPYEPTSSSSPFNHHHHQGRNLPSLVQINGSSSSKLLGGNSRLNVIVNMNDERPYKCSLCDLRFKKLPLLNRHVKTHSHVKRYVCRFCSHAFKRSDNLLAHMRTSCKGVKEADTKFAAGGGRSVPPPQNRNNGNQSRQNGQIINQLLSSPPTAGSPMVSRSQLEEALLNLRAHHQEEPQPRPLQQQERRYSSPLSPLVSTTTASPPPPPSHQRRPADLQSRHSKLLEILSGSPVNRFPVPVVQVDGNEEDVDEEEQDMPLPLSLKVDRRASSPPPTCSSSSSSSSSSSQYRRSHHNQLRSALYPNELPLEEDDGEEQVDGEEVFCDEEEVENDIEQPLNLGRQAVAPSPPPPVVPSAKSRDHPEIVSILSRQPKSNVVMLAAADLRKLVGIDTL